MAAISLACLSITHPEISSSSTTKTKSVHKNHRKPNSSLFPSLHKTKRSIIVSVAGNSSESSTPPLPIPEKPEIELQFIGPKADDAVLKASAISGEKLMRDIMVDNKIELYAAYGKLMNCGGGGSCGTCIVEIIDGNDLLNERTNTELRYLKKKPESWRLACQTIVGDKQNSGKVVVQRLPQWKK